MEPQQFNQYLTQAATFQGRVSQLASSIELIVDVILEGIGSKLGKLFGRKIQALRDNRAVLEEKHDGDFDALVDWLDHFTQIWIITKHGMVVGGVPHLTFAKRDPSRGYVFHTFDDQAIATIDREFSETMTALVAISKRL